MQVLDGSSRAILAKGAKVGVPLSTLYRHLPILRHCLGAWDQALVVANCARSERPSGRRLNNLMLLTPYRLIITGETRLLHRLYLHLNVSLNQLADVAWTAEPEWGGVQFAATAIDGVREHFWIRIDSSERVWRFDALLRRAFAVPSRDTSGDREPTTPIGQAPTTPSDRASTTPSDRASTTRSSRATAPGGRASTASSGWKPAAAMPEAVAPERVSSGGRWVAA